jgi:hypothetical protein
MKLMMFDGPSPPEAGCDGESVFSGDFSARVISMACLGIRQNQANT